MALRCLSNALPHKKGRMPAFATPLSLWRLVLDKARAWLGLPEAAMLDFPFGASDIGQLARVTADPQAASVDEQTWQDLLLGPYLAVLSAQVSIFGQQVLHQRLRAGMDEERCAALGERLRCLGREPAQLLELQQACQPLRNADAEIAALLFGSDQAPAIPAWAHWAWLIGAVFLLSLAATFISALAWIGAGVTLYLLLSIQIRHNETVQLWSRSMNSLQHMLGVCSALGASEAALACQFGALRARAGQVNRSLARSPAIAFVPLLKAYDEWFMLGNVRHYFDSVGIVCAQRDLLRQCYLCCANLEADLALARHLARTVGTCWATRDARADIALEQAVHPLLAQAAPLSIALQGKGAFISGQNGVGKSTLLRTVGLNLIAARAFGFCYARSATVCARPVHAAMQAEDSLLGGESLYIAELRRARELLAYAAGPHRGIFIIDEIFRGTNHLESVSAAAAVLDKLAAQGVVVVSSHNLVLASLLEHCLTPLWVSAANDGVGPLALVPGVLANTNGIALLRTQGFGPELEASAGKVCDWLGAYLAHPADCAQVLGGASARLPVR